MFVLICSLAASAARAERVPFRVKLTDRNFEQIAQKKGVTVWQHKESSIIRLGAEGRFLAPPDVVARVLLDYPAQKGRIARVTESRVLARSAKDLFVYQHLNLPVISDRDFILHVRWGEEGDVRWIEFNARKDKGPKPRKGIVRVTKHEGSWQLRPISGGRGTFVRFMVMIDMSGWLPKWLARSGSGKEIPNLFEAVGRMVQERLSRPRAAAGSARGSK